MWNWRSAFTSWCHGSKWAHGDIILNRSKCKDTLWKISFGSFHEILISRLLHCVNYSKMSIKYLSLPFLKHDNSGNQFSEFSFSWKTFLLNLVSFLINSFIINDVYKKLNEKYSLSNCKKKRYVFSVSSIDIFLNTTYLIRSSLWFTIISENILLNSLVSKRFFNQNLTHSLLCLFVFCFVVFSLCFIK